jgi:hypothetical protein
MYRLARAAGQKHDPDDGAGRLRLTDWLAVHAVSACVLVVSLLLTGAPLATALLGAWLLSGLVSLGIVKAALDLGA